MWRVEICLQAWVMHGYENNKPLNQLYVLCYEIVKLVYYG